MRTGLAIGGDEGVLNSAVPAMKWGLLARSHTCCHKQGCCALEREKFAGGGTKAAATCNANLLAEQLAEVL